MFGLVQQTVAASLTDLERKNLRRAMYSREAVRTEEEEEGERLPTCEDDCCVRACVCVVCEEIFGK